VQADARQGSDDAPADKEEAQRRDHVVKSDRRRRGQAANAGVAPQGRQTRAGPRQRPPEFARPPLAGSTPAGL
jgi:hypothetical protein